jgi:NADP-dependent 3-hydroxy acid dehydrogenase YdfG
MRFANCPGYDHFLRGIFVGNDVAGGMLGCALVQTFVDAGWRVVGTGRSPRPNDLPPAVNYVSFDASKLDECQSFWSSLAVSPDEPLCLVNNAGGYASGPFLQQDPNAVMDMVESCYLTAVYMTRALMATAKPARILNVVSTGALTPHAGGSTYGAAKAAMAHFFEALQLEGSKSSYPITNLYPADINEDNIKPGDLADLVESVASNNSSAHVASVTIQPTPR